MVPSASVIQERNFPHGKISNPKRKQTTEHKQQVYDLRVKTSVLASMTELDRSAAPRTHAVPEPPDRYFPGQ